MFEHIIWYAFVIFGSIAVTSFFRKISSSNDGIRRIYGVLALVGVLIHELSHYFSCFLVGLKPRSIRVKYKYNGRVNPHGSVGVSKNKSFMQIIIISLAPLLVSAWLILYCWDLLFSGTLTDLYYAITFFLCISLFIGANPSNTDLKLIPRVLRRDPKYSLIQVGMVIIAVFFSWITLATYKITLVYEFLIYFIIGGYYFVIKYGYIYSRKTIAFLFQRNAILSSDINYKKYLQKKHKPTSPLGNKYKYTENYR